MSGSMAAEVAAGRTAGSARSLQPWLVWPVSIVWASALVLAIAASIGSIWAEASGRVPMFLQQEAGIRTMREVTPAGVFPGLVPFSDEALRSGIRSGDILVAINGAPVTGQRPPTVATVSVYTVRSRDGKLSDHRLTRSRAHLERFFASSGISPSTAMMIRWIAGGAGNFALIAAALLLFVRRRNHRVPMLLSFAFLAIALTIDNASAWALLEFSDLRRVPILITGWTLLILALLQFPEGRFAWRWQRRLAWFTAIATALVTWDARIWTFWIPIHGGLLLIAAGSILFRYRNLPPGAERQQVRWALLGFVAGSVVLAPALYLDVGVAPSNAEPRVWIWAMLAESILIAMCLVLIAGGLLVSLLRYRLYDAEVVIARSVSIGVLTIALLATFAGTEKIIELLGEEYFGARLGVLAGGIGAAFAAVMIVPLHHRLSHWAEHKFQKDLIRLKRGLPLLVGDMRETAPVGRIAAVTLDSVTRGVRATRAALVIDGELADARGIEPDEFAEWRRGWHPAAGDGLDAARDDATFPLRVPLEADGHGRIGWLLLGPRPDGSFYGKDEREALAAITDPVARALEVAAARQTREADEARRWQAQESLNAEIRSVNGELVRVLGSLDAKLAQLVPLPTTEAAE